MTPEQAIREAREAALKPVYLVVGEERYLVARVVAALREAALGTEGPSFNDDRFVAGEHAVETVLAAANTVPMMAKRRAVTVQAVERWEQRASTDDERRGPLDALADYVKSPCPSTVLLLVASKLHGQRRVVTAAKHGGALVQCEPLQRRELPAWIRQAAAERGHRLSPGAADALADLLGPDLAPVDDAIERLSLYVGKGGEIDEDAVSQVVTRVRLDTVWQLVDALAARRLGPALAALADAHDARDAGPRVLGAIAWSVKQLARYAAARRAGVPPPEAAKAAGVPPFKVQQVERAARDIGVARLEHWLERLFEADRALKSSRRPGQATLEAMLIDLCR
jgi:DNA polymerase-3 subunit delta